jgi:hypothetical protein
VLRRLSRLLRAAVDAGDGEGLMRGPRRCLQLTQKLQPTLLVRSAVPFAEDAPVDVPAGSGGAAGVWETPPVKLDGCAA